MLISLAFSVAKNWLHCRTGETQQVVVEQRVAAAARQQ
jgi:hypothetical protein